VVASVKEIQSKLLKLCDYDSLLSLLETMGFTYCNEPRSTVDWPDNLKQIVQEFRCAAVHGSFNVSYIVLQPDRMIGTERQVVTRVLKTDPHSLFIFTDPSYTIWHIVHVRYDEKAEQRRQLRRFVIDLQDTRISDRLRTTVERLSCLAIPQGLQLSVLAMQAQCDEAFRVSAISDRFLKSFVQVVKNLTVAQQRLNPSLLPTDAQSLKQAQLLMDRLVFLYFVQKKGWLNGEPDYLYRRFRNCFEIDPQADTFYRERLLPLFRALSHRNAQRPRLDDGTEEALPFLNGGLFELPLSYGTANQPLDEKIRITNEVLKPVFDDFLESYNFTTSEDTPLDIEVAINPEVIGTIFETFVLTAEKDAETNAPDLRKATGSYYTPRCVVHLICQAVFRRYLVERTAILEDIVKQLVDFLPVDQLTPDLVSELQRIITSEQANSLKNAALSVRACDPAVGSGAFPVGLLHEIVKLVSLLDLRLSGMPYVERPNYIYELKRRVIENCLYGVDIQEQAVQICELRLWLSLIVDHQVSSALPLLERIRSIEPLPNLTFRIRVGDSLLDRLFGKVLDIKTVRHEDLIGDISAAKNLYYESQSPEAKRELEMRIISLQLKLLESLLLHEQQITGAEMPLLEGITTSRRSNQLEQVKARLADLESLLKKCRQAQQLATRPLTHQWEYARAFDAIRQEFGVSFIWQIDFAEVFDPGEGQAGRRSPGFDIIVGNPPFVTARNPVIRELYRDQWPTSCLKKYHLLAPFAELALVKLLRPHGQFGYIVSNAFATRDFGKPLIEQVFTRMELLNVIDCQGLSFPGHGTPTCILLGYGIGADVKGPVTDTDFKTGKPTKETILCSTRLGKGQLHQEAEETDLWREIESGWEKNSFAGNRVLNAVWETKFTRLHPWSLNAASIDLKSKMKESGYLLHELLKEDIGFACIIGADDLLNNDEHQYRRLIPTFDSARWLVEGDNIRDWSIQRFRLSIATYDESWLLSPIITLGSNLQRYFSKFKPALVNRADFGALTYAETGKPWWGYHQVTTSKYMSPSIIYGQIATHMHCLDCPQQSVIKHSVQLISFKENLIVNALLSLLNSSSSLYYLKQICYNKGAGAVEERDRFDYAGGKVDQLPIPAVLLENTVISKRASFLSKKCSGLGIIISDLQPRKLFERPGEAYTDWYVKIRGYQRPDSSLNLSWDTSVSLHSAWQSALKKMDETRKQMIALQEEIDWLIYGAYNLLPIDHPAVNLSGTEKPLPIDRAQRPFSLILNNQPVPAHWPVEQRKLWEARMQAIADNDLIREVEQPAYKRRWESPFDDRDFLKAYEWWLCEKAEGLLEHKFKGGPVDIDIWSSELHWDRRVQSAYEVALEIGGTLGDVAYKRDADNGNFTKHLKHIIEEETVPDNRVEFKKKHVKLRGIDEEKHLPNGVPRERFRAVTASPGKYVWAGKDIWGGVKGDKWDG
jgi:hypothetical protein